MGYPVQPISTWISRQSSPSTSGPLAPAAPAPLADVGLPHHDDDELLLPDGDLLKQRHLSSGNRTWQLGVARQQQLASTEHRNRCWQQQRQQRHLHPQLVRHIPAAAGGTSAAVGPYRGFAGQHAEERKEEAAGMQLFHAT